MNSAEVGRALPKPTQFYSSRDTELTNLIGQKLPYRLAKILVKGF